MRNNLSKLMLVLSMFCTLVPSIFAKPLALQVQVQQLNRPLNLLLQHDLNLHYKNIKFSSLKVLHQKLFNSAKMILKNHGYFASKIDITFKKNKGLFAKIHVKQGTPTRVHQIKLSCLGKKCDFLQQALKKLPLKEGMIYNTDQYNKSVNQLIALAHQHGHFFADAAHSKLLIIPQQSNAKIFWKVNLGPKLYLRKIHIYSDVINKKLIKNLLDIKANKVFSNEWLSTAEANLIRSGYFSEVQLTPKFNSHNTVDIFSKLKLNTSSRKVVKVGYNSDTGFKTMFGIFWPHINSFGHQVQLTSTLGPNESNLILNYTIPAHNRPAVNQWHSITQYEHNLDLRIGTSQIATQRLSYEHTTNQMMYSTQLNWMHETSEIAGLTSKKTLFYLQNKGYYDFKNSIKYFDRLINSRFAWQLRLANNLHPRDQWFSQYLLELKSNVPVTMNHGFYFRVITGQTFVNNLNQVPLSLQLATGGSQSVRGYLFNEIGPSKDMHVLSAEYQYRLMQSPWHLCGFIDAANLNKNWTGNWFKGPGIGLAWHNPFIHLELSLARAISLPKKPFRLQLSVQV